MSGGRMSGGRLSGGLVLRPGRPVRTPDRAVDPRRVTAWSDGATKPDS